MGRIFVLCAAVFIALPSYANDDLATLTAFREKIRAGKIWEASTASVWDINFSRRGRKGWKEGAVRDIRGYFASHPHGRYDHYFDGYKVRLVRLVYHWGEFGEPEEAFLSAVLTTLGTDTVGRVPTLRFLEDIPTWSPRIFRAVVEQSTHGLKHIRLTAAELAVSRLEEDADLRALAFEEGDPGLSLWSYLAYYVEDLEIGIAEKPDGKKQAEYLARTHALILQMDSLQPGFIKSLRRAVRTRVNQTARAQSHKPKEQELYTKLQTTDESEVLPALRALKKLDHVGTTTLRSVLTLSLPETETTPQVRKTAKQVLKKFFDRMGGDCILEVVSPDGDRNI